MKKWIPILVGLVVAGGTVALLLSPGPAPGEPSGHSDDKLLNRITVSIFANPICNLSNQDAQVIHTITSVTSYPVLLQPPVIVWPRSQEPCN